MKAVASRWQETLGNEDGADLAALLFGGSDEWRGRNSIPESHEFAGGFQGGQPVAVGVQDAESSDLTLELDAGLQVVGESGPV